MYVNLPSYRFSIRHPLHYTSSRAFHTSTKQVNSFLKILLIHKMPPKDMTKDDSSRIQASQVCHTFFSSPRDLRNTQNSPTLQGLHWLPVGQKRRRHVVWRLCFASSRCWRSSGWRVWTGQILGWWKFWLFWQQRWWCFDWIWRIRQEVMLEICRAWHFEEVLRRKGRFG